MFGFEAFVLFVMIWWVVLFAVLPFGVKPLPQSENPAGWNGAPERPLIWRKVLVTTAISLVFWGIGLAIIHSGHLSFRVPASYADE